MEIILNVITGRLVDRGAWILPLGKRMIRVFPGEWSLKQRRDREKYQATTEISNSLITSDEITDKEILQTVEKWMDKYDIDFF